MDKFGIFNLLGSFLDAYKKQAQNPQENLTKSPNPLSNIFSSLPSPKPTENNPSPPPTPLQQSMVATMRSHDEFVKRVNKNLKH